MMAGFSISALMYVGSYLNTWMVLEEHLDESIVGLSSTALTAVVTGLAMPAGYLISKFGYRKIMLLGSLICALAVLSLIVLPANAYLTVFLNGVFGVASVTVVVIGSPGLINQWFVCDRSLPMALMMAASPASGFLIPPVLTRIVELWGWRVGYFFLLVGLFLVIVLFLFFLREPSHHAPIASDTLSRAEEVSRTFSVPSRHQFWIFSCSAALRAMVYMGCVSYSTLLAIDRGFTAEQAAVVLMGYSVGGMSGRLLAPLWRRFHISDMASVRIGTALCGIGGCLLFVGRNLLTLTGGAAAIAVGFGLSYSVSPILFSNWYGDSKFAKAYGKFTAILQVGYTVGPVVIMGLSFVLNGYEAAFGVLGVVNLLAILLLQKLPEPIPIDFVR